jgi:phosphoheptose isomerase
MSGVDGMRGLVRQILNELVRRWPELDVCRTAIEAAFEALSQCYAAQNKVMVCGNGGSAADAEHIVGELMKGFRYKRLLSHSDREKLQSGAPQDWPYLVANLQGALPAISLVSQTALLSAVANDLSPEMVYAQQVYGYGHAGDLLIGLSTSGNAQNVINAFKVARAFGINTLGMTGHHGGGIAQVAAVTIQVPATDTFKAQEYHLPIYHALCAMIEAEFVSRGRLTAGITV